MINNSYGITDFHLKVIDLSEGRFLQLKHAEKNFTGGKNTVGFLSNRDLIILKHKKIYLYSFENNKPTDANIWECFQIYDIEIHQSLKETRN